MAASPTPGDKTQSSGAERRSILLPMGLSGGCAVLIMIALLLCLGLVVVWKKMAVKKENYSLSVEETIDALAPSQQLHSQQNSSPFKDNDSFTSAVSDRAYGNIFINKEAESHGPPNVTTESDYVINQLVYQTVTGDGDPPRPRDTHTQPTHTTPNQTTTTTSTGATTIPNASSPANDATDSLDSMLISHNRAYVSSSSIVVSYNEAYEATRSTEEENTNPRVNLGPDEDDYEISQLGHEEPVYTTVL